MARPLVTISLFTGFVGCLLAGDAQARDRLSLQAAAAPAIVEASPALAPFQHVRNIEDRWTIAPTLGDCNDYAVTKRHELVADGLPARALRLSVVKTASGIGHLVLVVTTNKGDLVLDNLTDAIRPWQRTSYQWLKIQSAEDARFWYAIAPARAGTVASLADSKLRLASR